MNEFEGRFKDWTMDRLKKKERKFANDADYFRRQYKKYHTPENDRDLRITTDVLYAIRKEIYERTGRYGYYESPLEQDSSPTSRGWFGEPKRHSEAAIKGRGGIIAPTQREAFKKFDWGVFYNGALQQTFKTDTAAWGYVRKQKADPNFNPLLAEVRLVGRPE